MPTKTDYKISVSVKTKTGNNGAGVGWTEGQEACSGEYGQRRPPIYKGAQLT